MAAMKRRTSKIEVTSGAGLAHGTVLAIGTGEDMELVRVRWPWWRRLAAWLRLRAYIAKAAGEGLAGDG